LSVRELAGAGIFKFLRFVLRLFGNSVSLGANTMSYPELSNQELNFVIKIHSQGLTMTSLDSLKTLAVACKYLSLRRVEGDIVESGVWRGGSALVCAYFLRAGQSLYLFDTYAGMTRPGKEDFRIGENDNSNTLKKWSSLKDGETSNWVKATLNEVQRNFDKFDLLNNRIQFIEGKVEETIPKVILPRKLALVRIDTDFYSSTKIALEIFWPKLSPGGILILDDYAHWDGARRAADEFFAESPQLMIPIAGGGGRIIIKSNIV
jgi:hypothetical protein